MIVDVVTKIDFYGSGAPMHLDILFLEDEQELAGVHDRVQLSQGLRLPLRPQDVEHTSDNATKG